MEPCISALVSTLIEAIPVGGIHDNKLHEWKEILLSIEKLLENAEERRFTEPAVGLWLLDVQNLVYEIEDLEDTDFGIMDEPQSIRSSKLHNFLSGMFSCFTCSYATNFRIAQITKRLQQLDKTKNKLGLYNFFKENSDRYQTSYWDQPFIYGREDDSAAILTWLLDDGTKYHGGKVRIISIVGMGGIGKTTLAQSLYHNEQVRSWFHDRVWVSVTEDFDVLEIYKDIYEGLYNTSCNLSNLSTVQRKLCEKLSNKKFLLVLDDVWNQDFAKWKFLCAPFYVGAPGSTVIVTTRSHDIAKIIRSTEVYDLPLLSDEDCVSLFKHAVQQPNFDMHPEFKEVGEVIAKRCKGLPLAAQSLGVLLCTEPSLTQWEEIATSKIFELRDNAIISSLSLSYHHLPPYLKPLFAYASLFPKGYEFDKQELILLWMAQGFLKQSPRRRQWRHWQWRQWLEMEELGSEYFNDLVSMSFFQRSTGNNSRFIMHDLNHDLAEFVAGLTCFRLDDDTVTDVPYNVYKEVRHVSFISHEYGDLKKLEVLNEARCLRSLLTIRESSSHRPYLSNLVLKDFPRLLCLRALSFNGYCMRELPKPIGDLYHLRYLDVSRTNIKELPESLCALSNLQTLLLYGCHELVRLPRIIKKLINLRHLDVADTPSLKEMPLGIGLHTQLRTLSKFIVDKSERKITELNGLQHLQGTLSINGIENVMNVADAMVANLYRKEGLHGVEMKWSDNFGRNRDEGLEFEVLDALKPRKGLTSLKIEFYGGRKFPSWVGHDSFHDMVKVSLIGCRNCTILPPLGQLKSLKELYIEGMDELEVVGPEFYGAGSHDFVAFQSLTSLSFIDMCCWEEWYDDSTSGYEYLKTSFPRLQELKISRCQKLCMVSVAKIPSLVELILHACQEIVLKCLVQIGSVKKLVLRDIIEDCPVTREKC